MKRVTAFTLIEFLVVAAIIVLLGAMLIPSLSHARGVARFSTCASQMHALSQGLALYSATHQQMMPPFEFSDYAGNLPVSGHWGGPDQSNDPVLLGRPGGMVNVNLWSLVFEGMTRRDALNCPSSPCNLDYPPSLFPYTRQFSSYCMRFPYSADVFAEAPALANRDGKLLGVYGFAAGGQPYRIGTNRYVVPQVRMYTRYSIVIDGVPQGVFDPAQGAILSDLFWRQDDSIPAPADTKKGPEGYKQRWAWCHGRAFNVLFGNGAVRSIEDTGTVSANTIAPGGQLADDHANYATYAEKVWQFFEMSVR